MLKQNNLIFPDYQGNSLVNIPHSILSHFKIKPSKPSLPKQFLGNINGCSKIVLFTIDGFGYNLWNEAIKYPFFKKINDKKLVNPITTVFPSTTAAAITTLNSGLTPIEHGLLEWNLYFQELDLIMQPFPYKMIETEFHTLNNSIPNDPEMLFNGTSLAQILKLGGVSSMVFLPQVIKNSPYNQAFGKDVTIIPYYSVADLIVILRQKLESSTANAFFYVYISSIDSTEHLFGPSSEQVKTEMSILSYILEKEFTNKLDKETREKIAIMLTADHGQLDVNPSGTIYLDQYPELITYFKKSRVGRPILPTGSPRDVFLNIDDDKLDSAIYFLKSKLREKAEVVIITKEIIKVLFGLDKPHPEFFNRLGNVLILPKGNNTVWYHFLPDDKFIFFGHHGGLSKDEMIIPFVSTRLSELN